jgi:hypothetical protein
VVIPTVTAKSFSLSFKDEILVNLYYTVSDMTDVVEQGMLVFDTNPGTADIADADAVFPGAVYVESNGRYVSTTTGIAAKRMGDTRYYAAYVKLTDGSYVYSSVYDYSPKKYAYNMLSKSTTSAGQKALCVAMLNYGTAAQIYFDYNAQSPMNADLTAAQQDMIVDYNSSLFTGAVAASSSKTGNFPRSSTGYKSRSATVSFEGALSINYYFTPNATVNGNMTFYYWTPADYAAAGILNTANASGSCAMVENNGVYFAQVSGISAKELDNTFYVAGVYTDAAGNRCCTGVIAYSLSRYCMNNDSGNMAELAQATAMYGYYAKAYFAD